MTDSERFDLVDVRLAGLIDEIAGAARPEYLDDIFTVTARTRQRPRWTFLERWLPVDIATTRLTNRGRVPVRSTVILLALLLAALVGFALVIGSERPQPVPPPFGLAANGRIVYGADGDLYSRDTLGGEPTLLVGGEGIQGGALFSRDGRLVAFDSTLGGIDHVTVTNADGSKPRVILPDPFIGGSADWSPDSRSMALVTPTMTGPDALLIAAADGSGARMVPLDGIRPRNAVFNPLNDGTLLVRGDLAGITYLFLVDLDGQILRRYDLPGSMVFGAEWEFAGATFSPDGKTIVYNSVENGPNGVRFLANVINTDGTNRRVVPLPVDPAGNYSQAWPVFSPDGKWIAMESWVGIPGSPATNQIAIVPADGSAPAHGVGPKLENQSLLKTWSPDGRTIIVTSVDRNQAYQVDVASGAWSILPWSSDMPDWQRLAL